MVECIFSEPVYWDSKDLELKPNDEATGWGWHFLRVSCDLDNPNSTNTLPFYMEEIISQDEKSQFILDKKITYGDFLLTSFFIILILGLAVFGIRNFVKNRKL
ncbi:unnamed protein product, partial [marine sediment metagenome]